MKTIWKYQIPPQDFITIEMPKNAKILSFHTQNDIPCIWVLVNSDAPKEPRTLLLRGTGHPIKIASECLKYIGSTLMMNDSLVWHLFEWINLRKTIFKEEEVSK